ncbi:hypothetical protein R9C00_08860 [Flammeovirgaceae bacterium SG7u.111]|nr:hypothetical protein [Flammeovirgaceae bacterium SG7u.132]WPO37558.1 hypothetical protein R9C00_08860 [Flammeovirgaceae bacterium SG7u.111]
MSIKKEYFIFEIEKTLTFVLTEDYLQFSRTKKYPYSDMALWRFRRQEFELHTLRHGKEAIIIFGKSDELVDILKEKGVKVVEREVEEVDLEKEVINLNNGGKLHLEKSQGGGLAYWFYILQEEEHTIWRLTGICNLNVIKRPVHLRFRRVADAKGKLSIEIKKHLKDGQEASCLYALLTIISFVAFIFFIGWLIFA